ncbi:BURP domain protein RD22-like [Gossypium australe]|uniref:BURP domain protein RD22-like n=1 Tax=Gossypium australe TaxID=47621 RepID=A0A5B6XA61_9ROSI|nr:BURP domain protein RD22-like [Gossypium australe]
MYWKSVFPNTPMPKALQNLLIPPDAAAALANMIKRDKGPSFQNYITDNRNYVNAAGNSKQEFEDGNMATNKDVFFFESKLRPGTKMNLKVLTSKASETTFLPRPVADSIPFSTKKVAQVLNYFSVQPKSAESKILKKIIEDCETATIDREEKFCATSLESFVDFGVSKLGKNIQLLSAELEKETQNPEFSIGDKWVKLMGKSEIVYHKMDYAYAVLFCHSIAKTDVYRVPLVGADGTRATILAICHEDTSAWSPGHLAFQTLKVKPGTVPICHVLSKDPLKHGSAAINGTMFFFREDLHPGKRVNLPLLAKTRDLTTFLPQQVARSIPFSSNEFPQILNLFSLEPESMEANDMEQTINVCEREGMRGEEIFCATSFESFVDSSVSKLGKNIQLLANELVKETNNPVFTIGRGIQNMGEEELVCHKMSYPYAVFLCHSIDSTVVYKVPLVGMNGTKAKALVICHKDTSAWSPNHPVLEILKVKPGTVPICHFAVRDTLAWLALCGVSHASADLPAEVHWKSVFPHTPMPKALKHRLLQPAEGNKPWVVTRKEDSINDGDYGNADPSMGFGRGSIISRTNITMYFFKNDLYPVRLRQGMRFRSCLVELQSQYPFRVTSFRGF